MTANESQKNEVIAEARNEGKTVHFASLMDVCHLKNLELEQTSVAPAMPCKIMKN